MPDLICLSFRLCQEREREREILILYILHLSRYNTIEFYKIITYIYLFANDRRGAIKRKIKFWSAMIDVVLIETVQIKKNNNNLSYLNLHYYEYFWNDLFCDFNKF